MFTGVKAAEAIDQAIGGNANALEQYSEVIAQEWGSEMLWAQRLAGLFYRIPSIGYRLGVKRPGTAERMGQILCGKLHYSDVANRALNRLSAGLMSGMGG